MFNDLPHEITEQILTLAHYNEHSAWQKLAHVNHIWRSILLKFRYKKLLLTSPKKFNTDTRLIRRLDFLEWSSLSKLHINIAQFVKKVICTDNLRLKDLSRLSKFILPHGMHLDSIYINIRLLDISKLQLLCTLILSVKSITVENQWNQTHSSNANKFPSKKELPKDVWNLFWSHFCVNTPDITLGSIPFLTEEDLKMIQSNLWQFSLQDCDLISNVGFSNVLQRSKFTLTHLTVRISKRISEYILFHVAECSFLKVLCIITEM